LNGNQDQHPVASEWKWDQTLYLGSADYYARGRLPYPKDLVTVVEAELDLDGRGRLIDVGCGPGSLTLVLAPLFEEAVGVDPDGGMIGVASDRSRPASSENVRWVRMRAEELPGDLGVFRVATFAQSFHWMNQANVAARVAGMLEADGWWIQVNATTHRGIETSEQLPGPSPPHDQIAELVRRYLGPVRRAGASKLSQGTVAGEDDVMRAAGYRGPRKVMIRRGEIIERSLDEVVAAVFSLSWAAPHLFGAQREQFEEELRALLSRCAPSGKLYEKARDIELVLWQRPL
jgi:SAM-dependent methyltransferase